MLQERGYNVALSGIRVSRSLFYPFRAAIRPCRRAETSRIAAKNAYIRSVGKES